MTRYIHFDLIPHVSIYIHISFSLMDSDKLDEAESYIFKAQACNANEELIQEWLEEIKDERKQKELQVCTASLILHGFYDYSKIAIIVY